LSQSPDSLSSQRPQSGHVETRQVPTTRGQATEASVGDTLRVPSELTLVEREILQLRGKLDDVFQSLICDPPVVSNTELLQLGTSFDSLMNNSIIDDARVQNKLRQVLAVMDEIRKELW